MDEDRDRYASAAGWEPEDPYRKGNEKARKELDKELTADDTLLLQPEALNWVARSVKGKPAAELFGPFWREGEVAVLFGERGSGKSLLAVQIAESIARGRPLLSTEGRGRRRKVLYVDLQLSDERFAERYAHPSPIPGLPPRKHVFHFVRTRIEWEGYMPPGVEGDSYRYLRHSIWSLMHTGGFNVLIIDDMLGISGSMTGRPQMQEYIDSLRRWAVEDNISFLLIVGQKPQKRPRPIRIDDINGSRMLAELADSVLAIGHSTAGPNLRYLKHIASRAPHTLVDTGNVLNMMLHVPHPPSSNDLLLTAGVAAPGPLRADIDKDEFLSFDLHGLAAESEHLRDYAAEARRIEAANHRADTRPRPRPRDLAKEALIKGILDGTYQKYLNGE